MAEEWRAIAEKVRNWGRWGQEDQIGTLNFITPEKVRESASLVKKGAIFPLGIDFNAYGPQGATGHRRNPMHFMTVDGGDIEIARYLEGWGGPTEQAIVERWKNGFSKFNDDWIVMPLQAGSQWDSLAHVYYEGQLYNGYPAGSVTSFGATKNSIDKIDQKGVVSRGVLLDVAHYRGVPHLPPSTIISPEELDKVAAAERVEARPGDIVVIRTGWWPVFSQIGDGQKWARSAPGVSWRCAEWCWRHSIAAIAADNPAVEVYPPEVPGYVLLFHLLALRDMGMTLGEVWNLEALSRDCAQDGVYEFQLIAPPLRVTGAVGSPVNPIALK